MRNLSNTVILPIAGVILTIVMTLELIQMLTERNNLNDVDTWMFFKWIFKSACAVLIVSNTWNIVMGVFDLTQGVVNSASGVGENDGVGQVAHHVEDTAIPRLGCQAHLGGNLAHAGVHTVKQPGEVAEDAAD